MLVRNKFQNIFKKGQCALKFICYSFSSKKQKNIFTKSPPKKGQKTMKITIYSGWNRNREIRLDMRK